MTFDLVVIDQQKSKSGRRLVRFLSGGNPEILGGFKINGKFLPEIMVDDVDECIKNLRWGSGFTEVASKADVRLYVNNYWLKERSFDSTGYNFLVRYDVSDTETHLVRYQITDLGLLNKLKK